MIVMSVREKGGRWSLGRGHVKYFSALGASSLAVCTGDCPLMKLNSDYSHTVHLSAICWRALFEDGVLGERSWTPAGKCS